MKARKILKALILLGAVMAQQLVGPVSGGEKLKVGSGTREFPLYYLIIAAGEENGYFRQHGLEIEWVPFTGGAAFYQAVAGKSINAGIGVAITIIPTVARGMPIIIVSDLQSGQEFVVWVKADIRLRDPQDLKGARVGVARLGGTEHVFGLVAAKGLGLEKEVKFAGVGGIPAALAGLRSGTIDAVVLTRFQMANLLVKGEVRELFSVKRFMPNEWLAHMLFVRKDFLGPNAETVGNMVKAFLLAANFAATNRAWSIQKMKANSGYSEEAANMLFGELKFTKDGRIDSRGLTNVLNFLLEWQILPREKAPRLEELFTREFTG